jgi:outer membrane protein, multidrug efflux system
MARLAAYRLRYALAPLACIAFIGAGCALKKPPDAAAIQAQSMSAVKVPPAWTAEGAGPGPLSGNWLRTFGDEQLVAAVKEAIAYNADLQAGAARVEQAMLYAKLAGATLYPSVDLLARGGGKLSGDSSGLKGAVLTATWELDLWGRVRYGRAAAVADAASVASDYEYARQSIAAAVAKNWFLATEAGLQAENARQTIRDGEQLVQLAETRTKIGVGNDEDVYVARANVGTSRDALRQLELAQEQALRGLELLIGRYPSASIVVTPQLPGQPDAVPAGLPSELLERRPDVVAAERRVAAAFNRIGEAKAARLPSIALTTGVSAISSDLFFLKEHDNPVWNLGARLLVPIYRGGALKTQVEIRTAEQKQAVANYASIGLRAFGEVENALSAEIAARERERILTQTLGDNRRAYEIVQTQFKVGSTDLRFVTQRELALFSTQSALIRMQAEQRVQRVEEVEWVEFGSRPDRPDPPDLLDPLDLLDRIRHRRRRRPRRRILRHIHRLRRKGDGGPRALDNLGDAEEQLLLDLEEVRPVARVDIGERFDVQRGCAQADETHAHRGGVDRWTC